MIKTYTTMYENTEILLEKNTSSKNCAYIAISVINKCAGLY